MKKRTAMKEIPGKGVAGAEDGAALITALLFLVLLTALGLAAVMTSSTEVMISRNDYRAKQALYAAEAGINDANARFDHDLITPDTSDPAYKTWAYSFTGPAGQFTNYSVYVKCKVEGADGDTFHVYSGHQALVKYNHGFKYTSSPVWPATQGQPVYTVRTVGFGGKGDTRYTSTIIVDVSENTLNVNVPGGMFSGGCLDINGASGTIEGGTLPGVVTNAAPGCSLQHYTSVVQGSTASTPSYNANINMNTYLGFDINDVDQFATSTETYTSNENFTNRVFGSYSSSPAIAVINNTGHTIKLNGCDGYGILIVKGSLEMAGSFNWRGLVYVLGDVTQQGGGNTCNIDGGIMAGGTTNVVNGGIDIKYNQYMLDRISKQGFKKKLLSWKRVYN